MCGRAYKSPRATTRLSIPSSTELAQHHKQAIMALTLFNDPFFSDVDRTFGRAMAPFFNPMQTMTTGAINLHPMDVIEKPDCYEILADAPGMTTDDVKVELHGDTLIISGEKATKQQQKEERGGMRFHRHERTFNKFSRSFVLPEDAKADGIAARMESGVLTVDIPKVPAEQKKEEVKRIRVSAAHEPAGTSTSGAPQITHGATGTAEATQT